MVAEEEVREEFQRLVDEDEISVEAANSALSNLGINLLKHEFRVEVTIRVIATCMAEDEDEVTDAFECVDLNVELDPALEDWDIVHSEVYDTDVTD